MARRRSEASGLAGNPSALGRHGGAGHRPLRHGGRSSHRSGLSRLAARYGPGGRHACQQDRGSDSGQRLDGRRMRSAPGCESLCRAHPICFSRGSCVPDSRRSARRHRRCVDVGQSDRSGQRTCQTHASGRHRHTGLATTSPAAAQSGDQCAGALRRSRGNAAFARPLAAVAAVLTVERAAAGLLAACVLTCIGNLLPAAAIAAEPIFDVQVLAAAAFNPTVGAVTSGSFDDQFEPLASAKLLGRGAAFWLKLKSAEGLTPAGAPAAGIPVVVMHAAQQTQADLYAARAGSAVALPQAVQLPGFRGTQDTVFTYVEGLQVGQSLYARVTIAGGDLGPVSFSSSTLDRTLARGAEHARMIALAFGALMAVALAALLIWFVLKYRLV